MATTQRETLLLLSKSILNRLENRKIIEFVPQKRQELQEALFKLISPQIYTEEDLRTKTLEKLGASAEELENSSFSQSDQYRTAKSVVRRSFGEDELNGLYFQRPLKNIAEEITAFFMKTPLIEEVYETDDALVRAIVEIAQKFNPSELH